MVRLSCLVLLASLVFVGGCHHDEPPKPVDFAGEIPAGMLALRKISPDQYPSFAIAPIDAQRIVPAIDNSLAYLAKPSSQGFYPYLDITHDRAVATLRRLRQLCDGAATRPSWTPQAFDQQIRGEFEVYKSYGAPDPNTPGAFTDRVLFTGYCTPIYDGSLQRSDVYRWPLYRLPPDLDRDPNTGVVHGRKTPDGQLVPYYTRGEIEQSNVLAGHELVWLASRWQAYVISIQGSARIRLAETGKIFEIGYAGTNGYEYDVRIADVMLADGVIAKGQRNLKGMGQYFAEHPEMMAKYLPMNRRYIFFTERPGGPFGCLNVPVTPLGSIATDKSKTDIYPRALSAFVITSIPVGDVEVFSPFRGFMLDQDAGGAIRASGRCDLYMGIGPQAEAVAGHEMQEGSLYYIALKPNLVGQNLPPP